MAARIEVPGTFVFEGSSTRFHFANDSGVLPLDELMTEPLGRKNLLAILGVGFQNAERALKQQSSPVENTTVTTPANGYVAEIMSLYKEAEQEAEANIRNFQATADVTLDAIKKSFDGTTTTTDPHA